MKIENKFSFITLKYIGFGLFIIVGIFACKKDTPSSPTLSIPILTTTNVSAITTTTARGGGSINSDGGSAITTRGVCWSTAQTPTIADNKTTDGTGIGDFISNITGLSADTPYNVRAYATNSVGTGYGNNISFTTNSIWSGTVTDIDGNEYQTVIIGTQIWMAENLKVIHYRNGDAIPNIADNTTWAGLSNGAYCDPNNDENNVATYGRIYNRYTVDDSRGLVPAGWRVPTDDEWLELKDFLGGWNVAGGKLKETGTAYWKDPNTGATNETGFTALPAGYRWFNGTFTEIGTEVYFWGGGINQSGYFNPAYLEYDDSRFHFGGGDFRSTDGFSVRCIKD